MATAYRIGFYNFALWRGPPPVLAQEQVILTTRAGASGIAMQRIGVFGESFEIDAVAHYVSYAAARFDAARLFTLRRGLWSLKYEGLEYQAAFRHMYSLDHVEEISCRSLIRIVGPGYHYPGGGELVMRFRLTPHLLP
jgi:hypothetical protein